MERRAIAVRGIVQGVGFRPFVYNLAVRLELRGFVQNQTGGVLIEVEGEPGALDQFLNELASQAPPLACLEELTWQRRTLRGDSLFRIETSSADPASPIFIAPDVATCDACLAELFDPADRRFLYPFLNCAHCGPRLTVVTGAPYDRVRTTLAAFPMCAACQAEYDDPGHRRFHAQPAACPVCGPQLQAVDAQGRRLDTDAPLAHFATALRAGQIGALKGLGGYQLTCDARHDAVVAELRRRKQRDEKPFALMVRDLEAAEALCAVQPAERDLLLSPRRPIVLLRKRPTAAVAEAVAPHNPCLGIMLPCTPLHQLLLHAVDGIPLVMTSGNRTDEPIATEDHDALERLAGIADLFLTHNRPIHVRCDDAVTRVVAGQELPLRRSRGYAPQPIRLPFECPYPILAVGGQFKGTFALGRGRHALLSQHLGDLDHYAAYQAFVRDIALYQQLFAVEPALLAHDLHPEYASTRYALERDGVKRLAVQHHHAHMASCMAEHGLVEPVIGVTFDGTGLGTDGALWGGEFLVGDYRGFRRAAHLRYVPLPGGEQAIREPWRMAVAHLHDAGEKADLLADRVGANAVATVTRMIERRFNAPPTSSVGRLFDAVAALAGVRQRVSYEGQAAMELEERASAVSPDGSYPFDLEAPLTLPSPPKGEGWGEGAGGTFRIDTRPLIAAVARDVHNSLCSERIARRFHSTLVEIIACVCRRVREQTGLEIVALSGGVFMNALLLAEALARLSADGFHVYRHRLVPPNDGGLCLGQLAIAAAGSGVRNCFHPKALLRETQAAACIP